MMFFSPVHGLLSFSASAPSVLSSPPMFYIPTWSINKQKIGYEIAGNIFQILDNWKQK